MPVFNNVLAGSSGQAVGYEIDQSVRFNNADSAYLNRTAGTATSNDIGTLSFWTKRGVVSGGRGFFSNHADANNRTYVGFDADKIQMYGKISGSTNVELVTEQVFRDPAAWYHVVIAIDVTQSTASNRVKFYINGSQVTDFSTSTYPAQDTDFPLLSKTNMQVGAHYSSSIGDYYDGYLAEFHFIDGTALTPASFGETNSDTNQWVPIEVTGLTYGNNGFYLKFGGEGFLTYDRESEIAVTSNQDWTNSAGAATSVVLDDLVNGVESNNDAGGGWADSAWAASGSYIRFDFGSAKTYKNAQWRYINSSGTEGSWKWQGSNNASDWTDIGSSFTLSPDSAGVDGVNRSQEFTSQLGSNTTAYRYYQILGISGNMNTSGRRIAMYFSETAYGFGDDSSGEGNNFSENNLTWSDQVLDSPTNNFCTINALTESITNRNDFSECNLRATANDISGNSSAWFTATMGIPPNTGKWYWEFADEVYIDADTFGGSYPDGWGMGLLADDGNAPLMADTDISNTGWWFNKSNNNVGTSRPRGGSTSSENKRVPSTSTGVFKCCYDSDNGAFWFGGDLGWTASDTSGTPETSDQPGSGNDLWDDGTGVTFSGYTVIPAWATINAGGNLTQLRFNFGQDSTFAGIRSAVSGTDGNPSGGGYGGNTDANGYGDFFYEVPTGFKALCSDNLSVPEIADPTKHFNTVLYTGNGSTNAITGVGFATDMVWNKSRSATLEHHLFDSVRGATKYFSVSTTDAEATDANSLTTFGSDGFTVGSSATDNQTSGTYASWNWKAAASNTSVSAGSIDGTNPTIACTRRTNTTAGFSVLTYTGTGSNATIAHGLSTAPSLIITKGRTASGSGHSDDFCVYSEPLGNGSSLFLNTNAAKVDASIYWNSTSPNSNVFSVANDTVTNESGRGYVAYCFSNIDGYSKVGSYVGNSNSDGPFIYTGFRPAFIMVKLATAANGEWVMFDNKRDPDNPTDRVFYANITAISTDVSSYSPYDILSNGFKSRIPGGNGNEASYNSNGETYIYLAFAESPFKYSNAR